jgi:hypothetical protein
MGLSKVVAAATGAVVLAGGGTFLALHHTDSAAPKRASTHVTTPATTVATAQAAQPLPSATDVTKSILDLTQQLQQAAENGGQPQPLTQDQVNALLQAQLAKLGLKS